MESDHAALAVTAPEHPLSARHRRRAVFAATLGNALEFYDFVTFAFFALQIGRTFFPSVSPFLSLMGSLATFGAGFLSRPLGAYVLGGYADRHGRRPAMLISMVMMGCGILLLAACPGYARIGIAAPIIAVIARLIQGFALGGEVGSASVYMMEAAQAGRRGFWISWQGASQNIASTAGALVGLMLSQVMTSADLDSYGWRIALLLGTTIVPLALVVRSSLPETHTVPEHGASSRQALRPHLRVIVLGATVIASGTIANYFFQYMATFGQNTLKLPEAVSFGGEVANNAIAVVTLVAGGVLSDRFGRKPLLIGSHGLFMLLIVPVFLWLNAARDTTSFIVGNLLLSGIDGFAYAAIYASISESLPIAIRARVFALVYAIPVTVFGGTTQLVITWILHVTGDPMAVAWYLTGVTAIGLVACVMLRESAPARVSQPARVPLPD